MRDVTESEGMKARQIIYKFEDTFICWGRLCDGCLKWFRAGVPRCCEGTVGKAPSVRGE